MRAPCFAEANGRISDLRSLAGRLRRLAHGMPSLVDRGLTMAEARAAEMAADRLDAELGGKLILRHGSAPLDEQI
jgi:hypothetical protein